MTIIVKMQGDLKPRNVFNLDETALSTNSYQTKHCAVKPRPKATDGSLKKCQWYFVSLSLDDCITRSLLRFIKEDQTVLNWNHKKSPLGKRWNEHLESTSLKAVESRNWAWGKDEPDKQRMWGSEPHNSSTKNESIMNQFDIFNRQFLFKKKMSHMWFIVDSKKKRREQKKKVSQSTKKLAKTKSKHKSTIWKEKKRQKESWKLKTC